MATQIKTQLLRSEFNYELPAEKIAQYPLEKRDQSKLLVLRRYSGMMEHRTFSDIAEYFEPGDALVINQTKVFPARLWGSKPTGGKVEVLLLERRSPILWSALVRHLKAGAVVNFQEGLTARLLDRLPGGEALLEFSSVLDDYLLTQGAMPLPPYIHRAPLQEDRERYQTVYATDIGSVAAPTAGLHFTPELMNRLIQRGVKIVPVTLHVGWGTFRGIQGEDVSGHKMLPEHFDFSVQAAETLARVRREKKRIIAVGTSTVRTLETVYVQAGAFVPTRGAADLFIHPGYSFQATDAMITNFHLPAMPPLVMTAAFVSESLPWEDGRTMLFTAYQEALRRDYRFASYGDAMLIL